MVSREAKIWRVNFLCVSRSIEISKFVFNSFKESILKISKFAYVCLPVNSLHISKLFFFESVDINFRVSG